MSYVAFGRALFPGPRPPGSGSLQRLSSGLRITRATDDPAGLAIPPSPISPMLYALQLPPLGPARLPPLGPARRGPRTFGEDAPETRGVHRAHMKALERASVVDIASGPVPPPADIGSGPAPPHPAGCYCPYGTWVYLPSSRYAVGGWVCRFHKSPVCG
jgi:hypothetical protein